MDGTYRQMALALSPGFLRGKWGERLVSAIALQFDILCEAAEQGSGANLLDSEDFPPDALGLMGRERMIDRFPGETDAFYRSRLRFAWTIWRYAGTAIGVLDLLAGFGLKAVLREQVALAGRAPGSLGILGTPRAGLDALGHAVPAVSAIYDWNWDGNGDYLSRFWIVVTEHPWQRRSWGDGSRYDGVNELWGAHAVPDMPVRAVRRLIRKWKPAHVVCPYMIVVLSPVTLRTKNPDGSFTETVQSWPASQPDGSWADPTNRNRAALYAVTTGAS